MLPDYHIHTPYCGHAQGKIVQYVESAIARGLTEIGFADHLGRYYLTKTQKKRYWDWGMAERDTVRYTAELLELRETYQQSITIRIGFEIDYIEGAEEFLAPLLSRLPYDFLLGSIHCLPSFGWRHIADLKNSDPVLLYNEYFRVARSALSSGLFNSLAHPDFIWRYHQWPEQASEQMLANIDLLAATAATHNRALEINANAFLWSQINEIPGVDPFNSLVQAIINNNTSVTIGSDAHTPDTVGKAFDQIEQLLKSKNITNICRFADGKRILD